MPLRDLSPSSEELSNQPFIKQPLKQQPYGDWEFEILDPNGYVLVFGGE